LKKRGRCTAVSDGVYRFDCNQQVRGRRNTERKNTPAGCSQSAKLKNPTDAQRHPELSGLGQQIK
jgi:hypothetical protein